MLFSAIAVFSVVPGPTAARVSSAGEQGSGKPEEIQIAGRPPAEKRVRLAETFEHASEDHLASQRDEFSALSKKIDIKLYQQSEADVRIGGDTARKSVPYGVGKWPTELGNHRAVVRVRDPAEAVRVHLPWRRRDAEPDKKAIIVVDAATDKPVANVVAVNVTPQYGDVAFQPATVPGKYFVYYLPSKLAGSQYFPKGAYLAPKETADADWKARAGLAGASLVRGAWRRLPKAELLALEAIDEYDKFTEMERIASEEELKNLLLKHPEPQFLLFPEDRKHPIRMRDHLPERWALQGPRTTFEGRASRGEFYALQIGVFAARRTIRDVDLVAEALRPRSGKGRTIPASAIRCFNTGGIDEGGRSFRKRFSVDEGKVGALWLGVQVPRDAVPGWYEGAVHVRPKGELGQRIAVKLQVDEKVLEDAGDGEPWRHSRLRWLDSTIAQDDEPVGPFTPLAIEGTTIGCLGREVTLGATGLPQDIRSYFAPDVTRLVKEGRQLLAAPIRFVVELPDGAEATFEGGQVEIVKRSAGAVAWRSTGRVEGLTLRCDGRMEFDGHVEYRLQLTADRETPVRDLRLEVPMKRGVARYMMGMGRPGGLRPAEHRWRWDRPKNQDSVWLGEVNAGLRCRLFGENYRRPVINIHYRHLPLNLPPAWYNEGKGGCTIMERGNDRVVLKATSGARTLRSGETLHFNFSLLITPLKPLNTDAHWAHRYYHAYQPPETVARAGANVVNIHHGNRINPFINYPFLRTEGLKQYVDDAHARGLKVKIYYTVRELSNHAAELWALRSLGDEVLAPGPGGGHTWLQEHLDPPYVPAWHTPGVRDVAFVTGANSRWNNYYLEGLDWLVRNVGIDGLYIDDVAYDRTVIRRVRKILDRRRPGSLIDLHSWNHFNQRAGFACCLNLYMEHLPYIDRVWIGEARNYDTPPDYWLIEISGIPFGVMGEMLQGGGNPWRGMVYGITARLPYMADPRPIWKVWDEFGMQGSRMIGYWVPNCPVKTNHQSVPATVYRKPSGALISLASWAAEKVDCRLAIDFSALGIDASKARLRAPAVDGFQNAATFRPSDAIPVQPGRGWLLILDETD